MSNIRIDIASEFKDKGFKQADKATGGLDRKLSALGKTLVGVLSVRAITQFGKASVRAFSEDEQAASRLSQSLKNLGLAFEDARVSKFISDLEAASGVLDDSLRPAMQSLLMTTGSVAKSQELMALALDMSRASGIDVATVSKDLSKAYVGQTRSLSKYNTGLSQVELKTKNFAELQEILQSQFTGQSAAFLDTYAGRVSVLNVAYANMQETIGKGLVDAFEILSGDKGIGGGVSAMDRFGDAVADTTRGVASLVAAFKDVNTYGATALDLLRNLDITNPVGSAFGYIRNLGKAKPAPFREPMTISGSTDKQVQIEKARARAEAEAAKRQKELVALTKKQVKAQEALNKKKKEEGILGEIAKRFDLERIQVLAALAGDINSVERIRLELMQAILDEDVKRAIILEGQLIKAEAAAAELALLLDSLDEMVDDPFTDWPKTIERIKELLKTLNIKIPIETLFAEKGLKLDQDKMTVTKLERMDVTANNVYINGAIAGQNIGIADATAGAVIAEAAVVDADALLAESAAAVGLIDANSLLAESMLALIKSGDNVNVNVIVEGNVTTEQDLTAAITDQLYQYQKTGKGLVFSSVAI